MRILVTGGAGFIGSHVGERLLQCGHAVSVLDDLNGFYDPRLKQANLDLLSSTDEQFRFFRGSILSMELLERVVAENHFDQIIHLAALAGVQPSFKSPALYQRVNVEGTANVLECARKFAIPKVILASSSSVYGPNAKVPFLETHPVSAVISPYAASKLAAEALGHVYHQAHGLEVVILRFFTVYGPRQRPDMAIHKFASAMLNQQPVRVFGDGSVARDFTYVGDIVAGIMAAVDHKLGFTIINLGGAKAITLLQLIKLLEIEIGTSARLEFVPMPSGDLPLTEADPSRARRLLDFHPAVSVETGIRRFVEWLKQQDFRPGRDQSQKNLIRPLAPSLPGAVEGCGNR